MTANQSPTPHFGFAFGEHPDALRAFECQRERAARFDQVWSERHANALRELHQGYVKTGLGLTKGRTAWPLAVGAGKTESLVAFARAQYERVQRGGVPLTVLVCMERVAQLSDLYRAMIGAGIPENFVAVHHRKSAEEIASERLIQPVALADAPHFPVLLATHSLMLRGEANVIALNRYGEGERSLVVWDESLLKSQGRFIDLTNVESACGALSGALYGFQPHEDAHAAHAFIASRLATMREVFERQLAGASVEIVSPPEVAPEDETRYLAGIAAALENRQRVALGPLTAEVLREFLDHVQRPLRVVPFMECGERSGIIHYETLIPPSLSRLIVLDASHNIRLLTSEHDADLTVTPTDCAIKTFERVAVRHLKAGAGRDALERALPRRSSALTREIVEEVKAWPADEAGIIFTFKQRARDARRGNLSHEQHIRAAIEAAGIDSSASLPNGRARFVFLTWGQHTGVSDYAYCTRVLLVGVLRRSRLDLSAALVGQREDLASTLAADPAAISRVELSEMFHSVIQAAGRGSCRDTKDGKASAMQLALICSDEFLAEWWQSAMPGVKVAPWKGTHVARARLSEDRHEAIRMALRRLPKDQSSVSTRTLRSLARLDGLSKDAYRKALAAVKVDLWRHEGRQFVRVSPFD